MTYESIIARAIRATPLLALDEFLAARDEPLPCFAYDDAVSTRKFDVDGRLHVDMTPITKATVNEYVGKEIPRWKELGLDPSRVYKLLRDPNELAKAARSFNKLPLLLKHQPVNAQKHRKDLTIGTTGDRAVYKHPYLMNTMAVWDQHDIDTVEDNTKRAISSAYRYDADMTPGVYEGQRYDGVMRNIAGNHVVLCKEGRVGPDIIVGDSMPEGLTRSRKMETLALVAARVMQQHMLPMMAYDSAPIDYRPIFRGVTPENFERAKPYVVYKVMDTVKDRLAPGVALDDLGAGLRALLEALGGTQESGPSDPASGFGPVPDADPSLDPQAGAGAGGGPPGEATFAGEHDDGSGSDGPPPPGVDPAAGGGGAPPDAGGGAPPAEAGGGSGGAIENVRSFLQSVLSPEQMMHLDQLISQVDTGEQDDGSGGGGGPPMPAPKGAEGGAEGGKPPGAGGPPTPKKPGQDAPPSFPGMPRVGGGKDANPGVGRALGGSYHGEHAMDQKTVMELIAANDDKHRRLAAAREFIRPFVGDLPTLGMDTPAEVFRAALKVKGFDASKITEVPALEALLKMQGRAQPKVSREEFAGAQDASNPLSIAKMFPKVAAHLKIV